MIIEHMKIKINDKELTLADGATVGDALKAESIRTEGIAVALNGTVVRKADHGITALKDGDTLLIIKAFYGG